MPYSNNVHDDYTLETLKRIRPISVWDVGAGAGKYGRMLRSVLPETNTTAIEVDPDYIEAFKLRDLYGEVLQMRAEDLLAPLYYDTDFDTVILGDCIEHLRKSQGLDLLNFLVYRTRWIIVIFPVRYVQNSVGGKHQEAHISVWDEADFRCFEVFDNRSSDGQVFILIRGYL